MEPISFAVTWDYRCPFARNACEHLVVALDAGAPWDVTWTPFSLNQVHVKEGEADVWDDPTHAPALLAMQIGIAVRDHFPEHFNRIHVALFAARHDDGLDIRDDAVLRDVLVGAGVDPDAVLRVLETGTPLETFRKEHERSVADHHVFGVPTFIAGNQAVFVRFMHRPQGDAELARTTIERALDLVTGWPDLNEFKHTSIPR